MKKLFFPLVAAILLFGACNNDDDFDMSTIPTLRTSTTVANFAMDETLVTKEITVTSNRATTLSIAPGPATTGTAWCHASIQDNTVFISVDENEGAKRIALITIATTPKGNEDVLTKTITVTQTGGGNPEFVNEIVGDWDVTEFWADPDGTVYDNNHTLTITKIDETTVGIMHLFDDDEDIMIANVDMRNESITVLFQPFTTAWGEYTAYIAAMNNSTYCQNVGADLGPAELEMVNGKRTFKLATSYMMTIDGTPYPASYVVLGFTGDTCLGGFGCAAGTVWTQKSSTPSPIPPKSIRKVKENVKLIPCAK